MHGQFIIRPWYTKIKVIAELKENPNIQFIDHFDGKCGTNRK